MCEFPFVETSLLVAFFPVSANPCPTPVSILLLLVTSLRLLLTIHMGRVDWLALHRARIRRRRLALGHSRPYSRLTRVADRARRRAPRRVHRLPDREARPRAALLDHRAQHSRTLRRVRVPFSCGRLGTEGRRMVMVMMLMTGSADHLSFSFCDSWMTFCPEWLTGSPSLNTSNALFFWVYLMVCISPSVL